MAGPLAKVSCIFFVIFFTISIWNIIGSIYVEKVMALAMPTPRETLEMQVKQDKLNDAEVHQYFLDEDFDGSGTLYEDQFEYLLEHCGLRNFMAVRDLTLKDKEDTQAFFRLAQDEDRRHHSSSKGDNEATIEALVQTANRLKGTTKAFDIAVFKKELFESQAKQNATLEVIKNALLKGRPW